MPEPVYILGGARSDFKRNLKKEGKSLRDLVTEVGGAALQSTGIDPADVQSGIVGNFAAGLFTRQLHLGSLIAEIHPKLRGIPTIHTEGACASGALAVVTGIQQVMGGIYDVVLVVGVEQQKTMSSADGGEVLAAAGDYAVERPEFGEFMFPKLFGRLAEIYMQKYKLSEEQLALVAAKNYAHARLNPLAQMRDKPLSLAQACAESEENRRVAGPLKVTDCSQITDGAAAVILCSEKFLRQLGSRKVARLGGYGHATDYLPLAKKDAPTFTIATSAAAKAYLNAGCRAADIHGAEVHDCFSISEIVAYEILGLAPRGEGPLLLESGATAHPSVRKELGLPLNPARSIPVNTGGGLIGDGHPVGATGVRQVFDAYKQLTGQAGASQIEGAKNFLTFNMGGSLTTSVAMVWHAA
jgi:acetyl-CoA C-acetyltransferase